MNDMPGILMRIEAIHAEVDQALKAQRALLGGNALDSLQALRENTLRMSFLIREARALTDRLKSALVRSVARRERRGLFRFIRNHHKWGVHQLPKVGFTAEAVAKSADEYRLRITSLVRGPRKRYRQWTQNSKSIRFYADGMLDIATFFARYLRIYFRAGTGTPEYLTKKLIAETIYLAYKRESEVLSALVSLDESSVADETLQHDARGTARLHARMGTAIDHRVLTLRCQEDVALYLLCGMAANHLTVGPLQSGKAGRNYELIRGLEIEYGPPSSFKQLQHNFLDALPRAVSAVRPELLREGQCFMTRLPTKVSNEISCLARYPRHLLLEDVFESPDHAIRFASNVNVEAEVEAKLQAMDLMRRLNDTERRLVTWDAMDLTYKEIAEREETTEQTIKNHLYRIHRRARKMFPD